MCDLVIRSDLVPQIGRLREQLTEETRQLDLRTETQYEDER